MRRMKEDGSYASPLGGLRAKVVRLLGGNMGFESSRAGQEVADEENNHYYVQGGAKSALLGAEYKKAIAVMEFQRQRQQRFC